MLNVDSLMYSYFCYIYLAVGNLIYYVGGRVYMNASSDFSDVVVPEVDVFDTQT